MAAVFFNNIQRVIPSFSLVLPNYVLFSSKRGTNVEKYCIFATNNQCHNAMDTYKRTPAYDQIHFATMALESGAKRLGITPLAMYRRLKQQDLIHQRLFRHYDLLHTQSLDYVAEDIAETLKNWEQQ